MGSGQRLGCSRCNEQIYYSGDGGYYDTSLCYECESREFFQNRNKVALWERAEARAKEWHDQYKEAVEVAKVAREWIDHLEAKGGHYYDGIPGELMDALEKWENGQS